MKDPDITSDVEQREAKKPGTVDRALSAGADQGARAADGQVARLAARKATANTAARQVSSKAATKAVSSKLNTAAGTAAETATKAVADRALKVDPVDDSGKGAAKEALSNVAAGAAGGAASAGAMGALAGAGKGLAVSAAGNKKLRVWLMAGVAVALLGPMLISFVVTTVSGVAVSSMVSAMGVGQSDSITASGRSLTEVEEAKALASRSGGAFPWTIALGAAQEMPANTAWDASDFEYALDQADPGAKHRDLLTGAVMHPDVQQQTLTILEVSDGGDPDLWVAHEMVEAVYLAALESSGFDQAAADRVFAQALDWELGVVRSCPVDRVTPAGDGVDGSGYSAAQTANARTIIGIAKGMFGADWEKAATVAIMTALQESQLKIYANDGVIDSRESARLDEYPASAYATIAASVNLPHDAVGTDFTSLGLFQQNFVGGWGTLGSSTYQSDPDGTMVRLMDPEFSSYSFFRSLGKVSGWQAMDPVAASHEVQRSNHPDAPRKHLPDATALVQANGDATALTPPSEDVDAVASTPVKCDPIGIGDGAIVGGWTHPLGAPTGWDTYASSSHSMGAIDLQKPSGTPIYAAAGGTVILAGWDGTYGQAVTIMHPNGDATHYAHLSVVQVTQGQAVSVAQQIGQVGSTGKSTGPHLHFEARIGSAAWGAITPTYAYMYKRGIDMGPCSGGPCHLAGG